MAGSKILVLGGTGPAGICLLRELVYRKHPTIVYARNPGKIPGELVEDPVLEIIQGEMDDLPTLSTAITKTRVIISLLGPNILDTMGPDLYANFHKSSIFPLMRQHGVRRIFAMGTLSISRPDDHYTLLRPLIASFVRVFANGPYSNMINMASVFDEEVGGDIDWTVFRIAAIPGGSDYGSWEVDRDDGEVFVGWIGESGWTLSTKRAALARWLVDVAVDEDQAKEWIGKMPAVSRLAGSGRRVDG